MKGAVESKLALLIILLSMMSFWMKVISEISVPRGTHLVFDPSINATWWKTDIDGQKELVDMKNENNMVDKKGYLHVKLHSLSQGGKYSLLFYYEQRKTTVSAKPFPYITFKSLPNDQFMDTLECQLKHERLMITCRLQRETCPSTLTLFLANSTLEPGVYDCKDNDGHLHSVVVTGTELFLVPSHMATWWKNLDGVFPGHLIDMAEDYVYVDTYGCMRMVMKNSTMSGVYKSRYYVKTESEDRAWESDPFPRIVVTNSTTNWMKSFQRGSSIILNCDLQGTDKSSDIFWLKGDRQNVISKGKQINIHHFNQSDSGEYICQMGKIGQLFLISLEETKVTINVVGYTTSTIAEDTTTLHVSITEPHKEYQGSNTLAIIAVPVTFFVLVLLIGVLVVILWCYCKRKSKIKQAALETEKNVAHAAEKAILLKNNSGQAYLPKPWRETQPFDQKTYKELKSKCQEKVPSKQEYQRLNVLLLGIAGAGKSSFCNTVATALAGNYTTIRNVGQTATSFTKTYRSFKPEKAPFAIYDTTGLEVGEEPSLETIKDILDGYIQEGYVFRKNTMLRCKNPDPKEQIHVILFAIEGDKLDVMEPDMRTMFKNIAQIANEPPREMPVVTMMTKLTNWILKFLTIWISYTEVKY